MVTSRLAAAKLSLAVNKLFDAAVAAFEALVNRPRCITNAACASALAIKAGVCIACAAVCALAASRLVCADAAAVAAAVL